MSIAIEVAYWTMVPLALRALIDAAGAHSDGPPVEPSVTSTLTPKALRMRLEPRS